MSYQITITETREVTGTVGKNWAVIAEHGTEKEYGYTPEVEKIVRQERKVLEQVVDTLDLAAVIRAVNGL